ncbi:PEP-CTERM sorting domain-containing protein [Roseateles sp. BYS87W]|uniref:PEP-CTERM sorting domain-containing protein n=1 Tax=Pelomonas baiyunensis TaxID=3299026 RepID=A0ABW7GTG5_9BURK
MQLRALALAALLATSFSAQADRIATWEFTASSTKPLTANGAAASYSLVGDVTSSFAQGVGGAQLSALNTTGYKTTAANLSNGIQFNVETTGYSDIQFSFAQRNSSTASAYTSLQYKAADETQWTTVKSFKMDPQGANPNWYTLSYDFSSITKANDSLSFAVRLVASYGPSGSYVATNTGSTFASSGTIRYDNVTFSGTAIPDPLPVPEPQTYALMLAGLATVAAVARRRRAH